MASEVPSTVPVVVGGKKGGGVKRWPGFKNEGVFDVLIVT